MRATVRWQRLRDWLAHALAVDDGPPRLSPEDEGLLDRLADAVVRRRMETPVLMLLESTRPLSYLASQGLHFMEPMATCVFSPDQYGRVARLLEQRGTPEALMQRIEQRVKTQRRAPTSPVVDDG